MTQESKPFHFISSKFHAPAPPQNHVSRTRLIHLLQDGLDYGHALTLISAPAGYGKSALVVEWLQQSELTVSWLNLDEADDDPTRFLLYFIAALQELNASIGTELSAVLRAGQLPPAELLVTVLANELINTKNSFICILDDFQSIQEKFTLDFLHGLLSHALPNFHLVLISREDPAIPLARLRARNQMTELRASELRFTLAEINLLYLQQMNLQLSKSDLALLEQRTEGWIAGLQLAGLSMQGRTNLSHFVASLSGNHRYILSYLTEEVLNLQSQDVQNFLMQCSILTRLTGDLCNAVTQQSNSAALLENLYTANLFIIPLDDEQSWYRFHPLFADLLRSHLNQSDPELRLALHQRASDWYKQHQMPLEAIEHALAGKAYATAIGLLEKYHKNLLNQGYFRKVEAWIQTIPEEWRSRSPHTSLRFAWIHLLRGNMDKVNQYLKQTRDALTNIPETQQSRELQAEVYALESNFLQTAGNVSGAITAAEQALLWVGCDNSRVKGLAYLGLGAGYRQAMNLEKALDAFQQSIDFSRSADDLVSGMLATTHLVLMCHQHGRLHLAEKYASQAIEWFDQTNMVLPPMIGAVYGALGLVYYEWNQMEKALECYHRGIQLGTFSGHNASLIYTKLNLSLIRTAEGDFDAARNTIHEAEELFRKGAPGWLRPNLIYRQVQMALHMQDLDLAESRLRAGGIQVADPVAIATFDIHLAIVRLLRSRRQGEDVNQAMDLVERIRIETEKYSLHGTTLQALLLGAMLFAESGNFAKSQTWLTQALVIAEPEGYFRVFIDEGESLAELLRNIPPSDYVQKLIAGFHPSGAQEPAPTSDADLIEPLTEREIEVLILLAQGLTYAEVASALIISVNTVRYHVKGIYGKLNVDRQAKALEKARQLNIL